nr:immunoglobulin heavy chain junction region [Mus musculus]
CARGGYDYVWFAYW